ncbi:MAG: ABC transporter substrate-binding protein [Chloroflexota bacterium]
MPIKIGYLLPLTGPQAPLGKDSEDGTNMYLESVNNTVAGRKVEVSYADTQGQPDVALTKAKQLVESSHANVLMGLITTPECLAVATYAKQVQEPLLITANCYALNLTTDQQFASPYLARFTGTVAEEYDPASQWAFKQGLKNAVLISTDYGGGIEATDSLGASFINAGGNVVQELHPPVGTQDYGPYVAQLKPDADVILAFLPGTDGLHFGQALGDYSGAKKPLVIDVAGLITAGPNLAQLKDKAVGMAGSALWTEAYDNKANKDLQTAYKAKFPSQIISKNVVFGYSNAQVLDAALKQVNGAIEQKQQFMDAIYATNLDTARGPVKLDKYHDIVSTDFIYKIVKNGDAYQQQLLQSYPDLNQYWDWTPDQLAKLQIGKMKGKWPGMTKDQLRTLLK